MELTAEDVEKINSILRLLLQKKKLSNEDDDLCVSSDEFTSIAKFLVEEEWVAKTKFWDIICNHNTQEALKENWAKKLFNKQNGEKRYKRAMLIIGAATLLVSVTALLISLLK